MPRPVTIDVDVLPAPPELAHKAAELFASSIAAAVAARGVARVAISGGTTPKAMFALLATPEFAPTVDWARLQLFWVDERSVPPTDPESNFGNALAVLLEAVPLPADNIFRMEGELEPEEAAARYESAIRTAFRLEGAQTPTFDLIVLGLGPDGHTASLFPHTEGLDEMARIVIANHVPQKDTWRLTLTWPVLVEGREVVFLIEGKGKAEMVGRVFTGPYDPEAYPAQLIRPASGKLRLLLDRDAAAALPEGAKTTHLELA